MFFTTARGIVDDVARALCTGTRNALICGGGYSYRSTRYVGAGVTSVGDVDLLWVVDDIDVVAKAFTASTCDAMGFTPSPCSETLFIDQQLFRQGLIAIVRISGFINSCKVGINVTTFDALRHFCCTTETIATNKVAHSPTYSVIVAAGTDRSSLTVAKMSPDISRLYSRGTHHLILDKNWYKQDTTLHPGTYTDFVATGTVLLDAPDGKASSIQDELLRLMVRNASEETIASGAWDEMFANAVWFSAEFRDAIRARCDKLVERPRGPRVLRLPSTSSGSLVTVFAEGRASEFYSSADGEVAQYCHRMPREKGPSARACLETLSATREGQLRLINAEVFRLSDIVHSTYGKERAPLPSGMTLDELVYAEERLFYRTDHTQLGSAPVAILSAAARDMDQLNEGGEDSELALLRRLTELRVDVALFLARSLGSDSRLFEQAVTDRLKAIVRSRSKIAR